MKKRVLKIIFCFSLLCFSCLNSQDKKNGCLDMSVLKPLEKITKKEKGYIEEYLNQLDSKNEVKTLFHPQKVLYFDKDCSFPNYYKKIRIALEILKLKEECKLIIETNADNHEYKINPEISLKRGEVVKQIFIYYGIESNRISIINNKDKHPIDNNETIEGQKNNRRILLRIPNYL